MKNLTLGLMAGFGVIAAVIAMVLLLSQMGLEDAHEISTDMISERIKPVGNVKIEGEAVKPETVAQASTPESAKPTTEPVASSEPSHIDLAQGEQIYNTACALCHATGLAGAPIFGNKEAWTPRVAKGMEALFTSALQGLNAMPPKGGQSALPDEDIKSAVGYMVYQVAPAEVDIAETAPVTAAPSETTLATDVDLTGFDLAQGEQVYNTVCTTCHELGILGAPKFGDKDSWAPRIARGTAALITNALQGFEGETGVMPAKAGNPLLPDEDVKAAVAYMLNAVVAGDEKEPTLPETAAEETTTDDSAPTAESAEPAASPAEVMAPAETVSSTEPSPESAKGEQVYKGACFVCHGTGVAGAPMFGNKDAWAPRVAKGMDALFTSALQGLGAMPPKGGRMDLADDDIKAAVDYMVSEVQ